MKFLFKFYGHIYKITNFLIFVFSIEMKNGKRKFKTQLHINCDSTQTKDRKLADRKLKGSH